MLIQGGDEPDLYLMFNVWDETAEFVLPKLPKGRKWRLAVDTLRPSPEDIHESGKELRLRNQNKYKVGSHSSVILVTL